jgi:uncharacterized membrane protein
MSGACPSCRLAAKVDAAAATRQRIPGSVPPHSQQGYAQPGYAQQGYAQQQAQPTVVRKAEVSTLSDPVESRALVALGYPLWPLALLSIFDRKQSHRLRSAAFQALGLNVGVAGMYGLLALLSQIPFLGFSAGILMPLLIPLFLVASVYYGIKTWNGDEIRVPIIGDWIEDRLTTDSSH